jgi:crossover junction endonuclease MUS81
VKTDEGKDVMIVERKSLTDLLSSVKDGRYDEQCHRLKNASGFPPHNIVYIIEGMFSTLRTFMEKRVIISCMASLNYFKGFSVIRTSNVQETAEVLIYMADKIDRNFMKGMLPSYLKYPSMHTPAAIVNPENRIKHADTNKEDEVQLQDKDEISKEEADIKTEPVKSYSEFVKTVKKENITQENIGEIMLCQIPGISTTYASAILKSFNGFSNMMQAIKDGSAKFDTINYESKGKMRKIPKNCGQIITQFLQNA